MAASKVKRALARAIAASKTKYAGRVALTSKLARVANAGRSDSAIKKTIRRAGIDLEQVARALAKRRKAIGAEIKSSRPRKHRPRANLLPIYTLVTPSGDDAVPFPLCLETPDTGTFSPPDAGFFATVPDAAMSVGAGSNGVGGYLGILASAWAPPVTGSLWYSFMPPSGGTLAVIAGVSLTGEMTAWSDADTWTDGLASAFSGLFPTIFADAVTTLVVRVHQDGIPTQSLSMEVAHVHCDAGGADAVHFNDDLYGGVLYAQIVDGVPVVIELGVELTVQGQSDFAFAGISIAGNSGPVDPGFIVRYLCLNLTPTIIL